jgi:hypothetical protein
MIAGYWLATRRRVILGETSGTLFRQVLRRSCRGAMVFVNWWLVGETTLALLMIAAGVIGFGKAGKLPQRIARLGIRVACAPLAMAGTLLGLLLLLTTMSGCESVSEPIYSPSGRVAVRIYDFDEGATGYATDVRVFWTRGLRKANVFTAPWAAVQPADIHWISNSELKIEYHGGPSANDIYCRNTSVVKIVCVPK